MFFWTAERAKSNCEKYEKRMDRKEFRTIFFSIERASRSGYDMLEWGARIREGTICLLEKAGCGVYRAAKEKYVIYW